MQITYRLLAENRAQVLIDGQISPFVVSKGYDIHSGQDRYLITFTREGKDIKFESGGYILDPKDIAPRLIKFAQSALYLRVNSFPSILTRPPYSGAYAQVWGDQQTLAA